MNHLELSHFCTINTLFAQLGLPADDASVEAFIQNHQPLELKIPLAQAPWWNAAQAQFLQEGLEDDANWAPVIDELNQRLRHPKSAKHT